jgi:hypothetical protein
MNYAQRTNDECKIDPNPPVLNALFKLRAGVDLP